MATLVRAFKTAGATGSLTAPAGTTSVKIQAWGAGGGGSNWGWGGGGGAYSEATITAAAGDKVFYNVGAGGIGLRTNASGTAGGKGGDSWARLHFAAPPTDVAHGVLAQGGSGTTASSTGGGTTAASIGTTKYRGGNTGTAPNCDGGGGGAGSTANGGDGTSSDYVAGTGGAPDGGNGATGLASGTPTAGSSPGGGGGATNSGTGGDGGGGWVIITFTFTQPSNAVTWNPEDTDTEITLSNGNLTGVGTSGGFANCISRSTARIVGEKYWEIEITDGGSDLYQAVGIANSEVSLDTYPNSVGSTDYFGIQQNEASSPWGWTEDWSGGYNGQSGDTTGIIRLAVNETTNKLWWQVGEQGWQPSGDPAAGTGGYNISTITGDWYAMMAIPGTGSTLTGRFASDHWVYSAPSGFTAIEADTAVTLDRVNIGDGITLTNGNLTGESRVGGENLSTARSTKPLVAGLDYYWEIVADDVFNGNYVIGVVNSTKNLDDWVASGTDDGVGINSDGNIYWNGGNQGTGHTSSFTDGDIVSVHYKRSDETIRFRVNGGTWSSYTNVSSFFSGDTMYAAVNGGAPGNIFTAAFARSDWTYAAPTGAVAIDDGTLYSQSSAMQVFPVSVAGASTLTADQGTYAQTGVAAGLKRVYTLTAAAGSYAQTGVAAGLGYYPPFPNAGAYAYEELTSSASWSNPSDSSWTTGHPDAYGGSRALKLERTSGGTVGMDSMASYYYFSGAPANGVSGRIQFEAKTAGAQYVRACTYDNANDWGFLFDLDNGTVASARAGGGAETNAIITSLGNGWYRCSFDVVGDGTDWSNMQLGPSNTDSTNFDNTTTYTAGDGVYLYRFQFFPTPSGGISTLTADQGTYALTGVAAGFDRSMAAAQGTYSLTGVAAGFDRSMAAAAGSYAYTGVAAALRVTRKVIAAQGTYSYTGVAAGFDRSIVHAAGTYATTGVAAGLQRRTAITAAFGTYTQTGVSAGFSLPLRRLTAAQGTYGLTGVDATLNYVAADRTLTADAGTYAQTGYDVTLRVIRKLTAAYGTYAQTGVAATLQVTRTLTAAQGSYAQTGVAAGLQVTRRVTAAQGTYAQTGNVVSLSAVKRLTADYGTYAQTGVANAFRRAYSIIVVSGEYALAGQDIILLRPIQTITHTGDAYTMTGVSATFTKYGYGDLSAKFFAANEQLEFAPARENTYFNAQGRERTIVQPSTMPINIRNARRP